MFRRYTVRLWGRPACCNIQKECAEPEVTLGILVQLCKWEIHLGFKAQMESHPKSKTGSISGPPNGPWSNMKKIRGYLSRQVVFNYLMFTCSSLRGDCGFHWNLQILMKSMDFDSEIHAFRFWNPQISEFESTESTLNPWISLKSTDLLWILWNLHTWDLGLSASKVLQTKRKTKKLPHLHNLCEE